MTEDEALAAYIEAGKALNAATDTETRMDLASPYWIAKDKLFEIRKANGKFPSDTCEGCRSSICCNRHWHHVGDCCIHCGNDERTL